MIESAKQNQSRFDDCKDLEPLLRAVERLPRPWGKIPVGALESVVALSILPRLDEFWIREAKYKEVMDQEC